MSSIFCLGFQVVFVNGTIADGTMMHFTSLTAQSDFEPNTIPEPQFEHQAPETLDLSFLTTLELTLSRTRKCSALLPNDQSLLAASPNLPSATHSNPSPIQLPSGHTLARSPLMVRMSRLLPLPPRLHLARFGPELLLVRPSTSRPTPRRLVYQTSIRLPHPDRRLLHLHQRPRLYTP